MARRITYLQYTNPAAFPPLEHSSRILADRGWDVLFWGSGAWGKAESFRFPPHPRIQTKLSGFSPSGWQQKLHYAAYCLKSVWHVWRSRSMWVYASDPLSCPAALMASHLPGRRVIYHEHDSPDTILSSRFMQTVLRVREQLCRRAAAVILPNKERSRILAEMMKLERPPFIVWNCPERHEVVVQPSSAGGETVVFYHGSLNPLRLPFSVLEALTLAPGKPRLHFAGYTTIGHRGFLDDFLSESARRGLGERVKYLGACPERRDLLAHCAQATIGLAFMPKRSHDVNMAAMVGASNKPFDYMACGLGLIVSDLPDWQAMFVNPGHAVACDPEDPGSIAKAIAWFVEHPREALEMRMRGRLKITDEWNYEAQFDPVLKFLEA